MEKAIFMAVLITALKDEFIETVSQHNSSIVVKFYDGTSFYLNIR